MTDRQTDTTARAAHWSITVFDPVEQDLIQDAETYPPFVKRVRGQMETCPETKREHFQGYVHTTQQRFSTLKKWLPKAHIEVVRNPQAIKNYVHKEETAIEGTQMDEKNAQYTTMHGTLSVMFNTLFNSKEFKEYTMGTLSDDKEKSRLYKLAVNLCMVENPLQVHNYVSNALKQAFLLTFDYWYGKHLESQQALQTFKDEVGYVDSDDD